MVRCAFVVLVVALTAAAAASAAPERRTAAYCSPSGDVCYRVDAPRNVVTFRLGAAVLGIANAVLKPMLAVLTLPLIVVTLGLSYFALNVLMLAIAEWIAPDFSIDGFWTYVGATIVVWLVNWVLNHALGEVFGRD